MQSFEWESGVYLHGENSFGLLLNKKRNPDGLLLQCIWLRLDSYQFTHKTQFNL